MRTPKLLLLAAAALPLALAGCALGPGGGIDPPQGGPHTHPTGAEELVVSLSIGGGLEPIQYAVDDRPSFALYGDGTVLRPSSVDVAYPGVDAYRLSEDGIQAVLAAAERADLLREGVDYGIPQVYDAPAASLSITTDGRSFSHGIGAPGIGDDDPTLTEAQREARRREAGFESFLRSLPDDHPELLLEDVHAYDLRAVDVNAWPAEPWDGASVEDWPLERRLGKLRGEGLSGGLCETIAGDELLRLRTELSARSADLWRSGGRTWSIGLRALLPGQTGCSEPVSAEVSGDGYRGYRMTPAQWAGAPGPAGPLEAGALFQASERDVAAVEAALPDAIAASTVPGAPEVRTRLGEYVRQYVGVRRDGGRLVYVNAFCDPAATTAPDRQPVFVADGGACFWQALVDPQRGELVSLAVNGEA